MTSLSRSLRTTFTGETPQRSIQRIFTHKFFGKKNAEQQLKTDACKDRIMERGDVNKLSIENQQFITIFVIVE